MNLNLIHLPLFLIGLRRTYPPTCLKVITFVHFCCFWVMMFHMNVLATVDSVVIYRQWSFMHWNLSCFMFMVVFSLQRISIHEIPIWFIRVSMHVCGFDGIGIGEGFCGMQSTVADSCVSDRARNDSRTRDIYSLILTPRGEKTWKVSINNKNEQSFNLGEETFTTVDLYS